MLVCRVRSIVVSKTIVISVEEGTRHVYDHSVAYGSRGQSECLLELNSYDQNVVDEVTMRANSACPGTERLGNIIR